MDSNLQQNLALVELNVTEEDNTTALTFKGTCGKVSHKRDETNIQKNGLQ